MLCEETNKRVVDIHTYAPVLKQLIEEGKEISLTITGNSMSPFLIHGRDQILIEKPNDKLKKGDMAFFQRANGDYVMHRICRVEDGHSYWFVGDAQTVIEGPISRNQIFGVIKSVRRKGKWLRKGSVLWEFFRTVWLWIIPIRPFLRRIYGKMIVSFRFMI